MFFSDKRILRIGLAATGGTAVVLGLACGGGAGTLLPANGSQSPTQVGTVGISLSDASTEDWATIGVKVLGISLIPQGGSAATAVPVYTAPATPPVINLVQLDQLSELLGSLASVPVGTYTGAVLSISAMPGDVTLVTSANPSASFPDTAATVVPSARIQIQTKGQGATGSLIGNNLAVPVTVNFGTALAVTGGQTSTLDLEFDLSHPAFLVDHESAGDTAPFWAVNFNGPVRSHAIAATDMVLRHQYGTVTAIASDNSAFTMAKAFPTVPPVSPETAVATTQSLLIQADSSNGTLVYNLDGSSPDAPATLKDFSSVAATLPTQYVRVAGRYQLSSGQPVLVAARLWYSATFNKVYQGPEGHVLAVDTSANTITVENELGVGVPMQVTAGTQFFFRTPAKALADATPIGTGTSFLTATNLVRGFKVHASLDSTQTNAETVDIEIAKYDGSISAPTSTGFTYTRAFADGIGGYTKVLPFISAATANPLNGDSAAGFKWWDLGFPTLLTEDPTGTSFGAAAGGAVNFGGTQGVMAPWGVSYATWNDPTLTAQWTARFTILEPTQLPKGKVATAWSGTASSFGMTLPKGNATPVTVDLDATSQKATLVYQVDRSGAVVSVTPVDITTAAGQTFLSTYLQVTTPAQWVKAYGIPQSDGSIKAYMLLVYTGTAPQ